MDIKIAIIELKKFSNAILSLAEPVGDAEIKQFEERNNLNLPIDFK